MESSDDHEQTVLKGGKHVMLSYNWNSQDIVSQIYKILKDEHVPIWFDIQGDMKQNIYDSMADGIENAAVVCCFMTPDYQKSENCKLELQYAKKRGKRIIPCMLGDKSWKPSSWLGLITAGEQYINLRDASSENIHVQAKQLIERIKDEPSMTQPIDEPSYLFELIKLEYKRNNRIDQIMNPTKSFSIEQSYINLAIVEMKEQQEQEKKLRVAQNDDTIIGTFEQIYGTKTVIDIHDIFKKCKDKKTNLLVLGRAGIGKSTFCQYITYKWATGTLWSQYDLLILFPLRSLTDSRYPPLSSGTNYTLIDLIKKEYFGHDLSDNDDQLLREQLSKSKVLWILDGYDEIVQNVPEHLRYIFEQLLKTPDHIVTSRPYLNTLSYTVQLEITGFNDDNIMEYVKQFFDRTEDTTSDPTSTEEKLINFLKLNPSIWGVAHIPINLELICSIWSDTDWSETKSLTITALYDCMTEWLWRRYLTKQKADIQMTKEDLYADSQKELTFLETLAFRGMENNTIILRKELLQKTLKETDYPSKHYTRLLSIGILKSMNDKSVGNQIEVQKDHYFIHLSFQEHFAARYLIKALNGPERQIAIDFIRAHKYNQRFQLVFAFTSGLLLQTESVSSADTFWDTIADEPLDIVGLRHIQLVMSCMEEVIGSNAKFRRRTEMMNVITNGIIVAVSIQYKTIYYQFREALRRCAALVNDLTIQDTLTKLLLSDEPDVKKNVLSLMTQLLISNPSSQLIQLLLMQLTDTDWLIRQTTCEALRILGEKAASNDVINKLINTLNDENTSVRGSACDALGKIGKKVAIDTQISQLATALQDNNDYVRRKVCEALGEMGEQAAITNVLDQIVKALDDKSAEVRWRACEAIGKMGQNAATDIITKNLIVALGDKDGNVRRKAHEALNKMGDKAATNIVMVDKLKVALGDPNAKIRQSACIALSDMRDQAANNDVVSKLTIALQDEDPGVREDACKALAQMSEQVMTNGVIDSLVAATRDENGNVTWQACQALMKMGEKAPIMDIINGLLRSLKHEHWNIRYNACNCLREMGEKAMIPDVITALVAALSDEYGNVQETACKTLGMMGERIASDEVISGLLIALGNVWSDVRENAWTALEKMNGKITTNDMINRSVISLSNNSSLRDRSTACRALGQIGVNVLTDEVINGLLTGLNDPQPYIRKAAIEAVGQIGEKAATNDVMNKLVNLLEDPDAETKSRTCSILGHLGEKVANDNVIAGLIAATKNDNWNVSMEGCTALGKMGTKATNQNVINTLVAALGNNMGHVRRVACEALGKISEIALSNDLIAGLVMALEDQDMSVRESACRVFVNIGEKSASDKVVKGLLNARCRVYGYCSANEILDKVFCSLSILTQLSSDTISKLVETMKEGQLGALRAIPGDQFIKVYLYTKSTVWLPVVTITALLQGNAVTITDDTMMIYGRQEPIQVIISDEELRKALLNAFMDQKEKLELSSKLLTESTAVSSICNLM